jgi:hypothetical protein
MDGLDREQRAVLAAYWWRRTEGEQTSWLGFQHVLADLRAEGSPESVVKLAERAVEDEYQHTQRCRAWALRFGHPGGELTPRGDRPLAFRGATTIENRLLRITLCGLSETVGCLVLRHARPSIRDLVCVRAYGSDPDPDTWDTAVHIQCSCLPGPSLPDYDTCPAQCGVVLGNVAPPYSVSCNLPSGTTCDSSGEHCTATSADVLRQDGVVCGCANIILK